MRLRGGEKARGRRAKAASTRRGSGGSCPTHVPNARLCCVAGPPARVLMIKVAKKRGQRTQTAGRQVVCRRLPKQAIGNGQPEREPGDRGGGRASGSGHESRSPLARTLKIQSSGQGIRFLLWRLLQGGRSMGHPPVTGRRVPLPRRLFRQVRAAAGAQYGARNRLGAEQGQARDGSAGGEVANADGHPGLAWGGGWRDGRASRQSAAFRSRARQGGFWGPPGSQGFQALAEPCSLP